MVQLPTLQLPINTIFSENSAQRYFDLSCHSTTAFRRDESTLFTIPVIVSGSSCISLLHASRDIVYL